MPFKSDAHRKWYYANGCPKQQFKDVTCPSCGGTGSYLYDVNWTRTCRTCDGKGTIKKRSI